MVVPKDSLRAIDVSDLTSEQQRAMAELVSGYKNYLAERMATVFKFEDWVAQTQNLEVQPKWRTFKLANISERPDAPAVEQVSCE
jgi:hypothetical protein